MRAAFLLVGMVCIAAMVDTIRHRLDPSLPPCWLQGAVLGDYVLAAVFALAVIGFARLMEGELR
jgi:hypothetical protein